MRPRLYINLPNFFDALPDSWEPLYARAEAADAAGVDGLWVADHVVLGTNTAAYGTVAVGGTPGEAFATDVDGNFLDPLIFLASVASRTTSVRLLTSILVAPLRPAVLLAKMVATLDVLSGGRIDLGVGVGWQREEYEALNVDFTRRGTLLDHVLAVCQTLWRDSPASFISDELTFRSIYCLPQPPQAGGVPIWVSGTANKRVVARIVRFADGWIPWGEERSAPGPAIHRIRAALVAAGRDPSVLRVLAPLPKTGETSDATADVAASFARVPSLRAAGVTDFRVSLTGPDRREDATAYLLEVVDRFRAACDDDPATRRKD